MESNLNLNKINSYSNAFAQNVCNNFFFTPQKKINGNEILTLSPIKQVNLFILKNLYGLWEKESEKLKSNFFNYESEEVKVALKTFLNVLSQNILISRADIESLVVSATFDTLLLILSPYDYYSSEVCNSSSAVTLDSLKSVSKYIQINRHLLNDLIQKFERNSITTAEQKKCMALFNEVCEQSAATPDDIDQHLRALSQVRAINLDEFYSNEEKDFAPKETLIKNEEVRNTHAPVNENRETEGKRILADTFVVDKPTLNEKFGSEAKSTLAEKLQHSKTQSIKSSIPINQKFLYINELFSGNIQDFAAAVDDLEECKSLEEIRGLINNKLKTKYNWNLESETYKDFLQTVERKFL